MHLMLPLFPIPVCPDSYTDCCGHESRNPENTPVIALFHRSHLAVDWRLKDSSADALSTHTEPVTMNATFAFDRFFSHLFCSALPTELLPRAHETREQNNSLYSFTCSCEYCRISSCS